MSSRLKLSTDSDSLSEWGRLFHNIGAKTAKAQSPLVLQFERGTEKRPKFEERSVRGVE